MIFILTLFLNGQELQLADMGQLDCELAAASIRRAGGDAQCFQGTDFEPEPEL